MANDLLHFPCPTCGIRLSVPKHLAGVTGPCPSCGDSIQAPSAVNCQPPAAAASETEKPAPRTLLQRSSEQGIPVAHYRSMRAERSSRPLQVLGRILTVMVLITTTVVLVYGILTTLNRRSSAPPSSSARENPPAASPFLADGLEPVSLWQDADATLEKFLAANDLAERMPLMETGATKEQLTVTCLAKPLPAVVRMVPGFRESDDGGTRVDHFYTVDFQTGDKQTRKQTMLVRTRGDDPPKVVADAFLDTYGGRLARYAANSCDEEGIFRAVVYAVAGCTDPAIPNHENKLTLKLMSCDNGREIASACFSRDSEVAKMLEGGNCKLTYGKSRPCTVKLRWNIAEDVARPFLEAVAIRDFGWDS